MEFHVGRVRIHHYMVGVFLALLGLICFVRTDSLVLFSIVAVGVVLMLDDRQDLLKIFGGS